MNCDGIDTTPADGAESGPLVSIGMPVYNGGESLRRALESLTSQTYQRLELIISDNASTDGTSDYCEKLAGRDPRVRYVRQETNRGAGENFSEVLRQATGPYFMWAAHDDRWAPKFVEENVRVLEARPDVVLSVSKVELTPHNVRRAMNPGTFPLMGTVAQNVSRYLRRPGYNSRFYGLMRADAIRRAFFTGESDFYGRDWIVMVRLLEYGKMYEVDKVLFERSIPAYTGKSTESFIRKVVGNKGPELFPLLEFARRTLAMKHVPHTLGVFASLGFYNLALVPTVLRMRLRRRPANQTRPGMA